MLTPVLVLSVLQVLLLLLMCVVCVLSFRLASLAGRRARWAAARDRREATPPISPAEAFLLRASLTLVGFMALMFDGGAVKLSVVCVMVARSLCVCVVCVY